MGYHDPHAQGCGERQSADNESSSVYTFMVTTFTVPGAVGPQGRNIPVSHVVRQYDELVAPISGTYGGVELSSGTGRTVSCFKHARDAIRAARNLQEAVDEKNLSGDTALPVLARIALHTGKGFVDPFEQQWEGVAVALRCASIARGGEVLLTDVTLDSLEDREEIHCLGSGTVPADDCCDRSHTVHTMLWNDSEREVPAAATLLAGEEGQPRTSYQRVGQSVDHHAR